MPLLFPMLLPACLINQDLYDQRREELLAADSAGEGPVDADADADGSSPPEDCDDADARIHPGATETCDGADEDCDDLVDNAAVDAGTWYADVDGDGHGDRATTTEACDAPAGFVSDATDCLDSDAGVHPTAVESWYDGVDQDCDSADDYDADGDGDRSDEFAGTDCNDTDPTVSGTTREGWDDGGVDNNCDGSLDDQVIDDIDDLAITIPGQTEGGAFGSSVLAVPAGWIDDEAVILVSAPFAGSGDLYGWRASALAGAPTLDTATWHVSGANTSDFLGFGVAWAGSAESPVVLVTAEGAAGTRGELYGWGRGSWGGEPDFTITGAVVGGYFGAQVTSGHDHDGDGVADILATAQLDSRLATNAGSAYLFLDAPTGAVSAADADIAFTTDAAGALLAVTAIGDADGDGLGDLGFSQIIAYEDGPGGLIVTGARAQGTYDVENASVAQLYAAGNAFGRIWNPDGDGVMDFFVATGGIAWFQLPLSGALTPWEHASSLLSVEDPDGGVSTIRTEVGGYAGHTAFVATSSNFSGGKGMVAIERPYWEDAHTLDQAPFMAVGTYAGDQLGAALDVADLDEDGVVDLVVGATGADIGGVGAGAVFLLGGAR